MAVAFRSLGQVQVFSGATSSTFTVPKPAGLTVGDFMLADVTTNGVGINTPSGWTSLVNLTAAGNPDQRVFYKFADTDDVAASSFAFTTTSATYGSAIVGAYTGVDTTVPIDFTATFDSAANQTSFTCGTQTTVAAGVVLVGGASANTGITSSSWTLPSAPDTWTEEWNPATGAGGATSAAGGKSHIRGRCIPSPDLAAGTATGAMTWVLSVSRAGNAWVAGLRPAGAVTPALLSRVVGVSDTTTARINTRTVNADSVRVKVGTDTGVTTGVVFSSAVTPDAQGNSHLTVTGLTAGTTYYYRVEMTHTGDSPVLDTAATVGKLRTAPSGPANFAVDFGSCCNASDSTALGAIAARDDDLFLHLGDFWYDDGAATDLASFRSHMTAKITATNHAAVFATRSVVYIPSDHDGMNNNSTAFSDPTAWTNWNAAYRELFPTPTLPGGSTGCYYTFVWGRVRFVATDTSSFKGDPSAVESPSKTGLGATQKQWIKDTITAATEPMIVIINAQPWIGSPVAGDDSWLGFTTERTEMANFFAASGKKILLTGGDQHCLAADDGSNSPGGVPIVHAAPFSNTSSFKGGPYSQGSYPATSGVSSKQYGRIVFTDDGTTVTAAYTGYDDTDTAHITLTVANTVFATTTGDAAASGGTASFVTASPATLTTATGDATAAGGTTTFTGAGVLTTTTGDAQADCGTAAMTGAAVFTTVTGDAAASGDAAAFTGAAVFTATTGDAAANGGAASFIAGTVAILATTTGDAVASGGTATMTGAAIFATAVGLGTADGGTATFSAGVVATFTTTVGTGTAAGGTAAFTGAALFIAAGGDALADGGVATLVGQQIGSFTTLPGDAIAAGGLAAFIVTTFTGPAAYIRIPPRSRAIAVHERPRAIRVPPRPRRIEVP